MSEKNNTTIYKKLLKSKLFFVFLIPIVLTLLFGIFQNFYYRYKVQSDLNKLNNEVALLSEQKNDLEKLIDYYKNESNIEKEARLRLNLKKEGERAVIILPRATSTSESGESFSGVGGIGIEELPNYRQWWYFLFKK